MAAPMAMVGIGANVLGGITGAIGAKNKARGEALGIQGQMIQAMGQAYQMDVQAAEYGTRANMSDYQAGIAMMNKKLAMQQADYARTVGEVSAEQAGMKARQEMGATKAAQAASGINIDSGSPVDVRTSMTQIAQYDQSVIRANAAKVAWGYEIEATQAEAQGSLYTMQAGIERMQATAATEAGKTIRSTIPLLQEAKGMTETAGNIGVMSSLINAAGSVSSKWMDASSKGLLPSFGLS
jgi:hypothetical protein